MDIPLSAYLQVVLKDELDIAVLGDDARDLLLEARAVRLELRDEVHDLVRLVLQLRQLHTHTHIPVHVLVLRMSGSDKGRRSLDDASRTSSLTMAEHWLLWMKRW